MHIALLQIEIYMPSCHSLKDKRSVMKRLINLVRTQHNVAVAEIGNHEAWQSAHLGLVTINNEGEGTDRILQRVIRDITNFDGCEIADFSIERL